MLGRLLERLGGLLHRGLGRLGLALAKLVLSLVNLALSFLHILAGLLAAGRIIGLAVRWLAGRLSQLLGCLVGLLSRLIELLSGLLPELFTQVLVALLSLVLRLVHGGLGLAAQVARLLQTLLRLPVATHLLSQAIEVAHQIRRILLQFLLLGLLNLPVEVVLLFGELLGLGSRGLGSAGF